MTTKKPRHQITFLGSVRTQLIGGFALVLILLLLIAAIGYNSLRTLQAGLETTIEQAARIRELSLEIETEFFSARQNETDFVTNAPILGYEAANARYGATAMNHVNQMKANIAELDKITRDADIAGVDHIRSELGELKLEIETYEDALLTQNEFIRVQTRSGGFEETWRDQLLKLHDVTAELPKPVFANLAFQIEAAQQAYLSTQNQQFVDKATSLVNEFSREVQDATPEERTGGNIEYTQLGLLGFADDPATTFSLLVGLQRNLQANRKLTAELAGQIGNITTDIAKDATSIFGQAQTDLQQVSQRATIALFVTTIVALILGAFISYNLAQRMLQRLGSLTVAAQEFGGGNLDYQAKISGHDEFALLAQTFNEMAAQLHESINSLEGQVMARTRRLQLAAEIGERLSGVLQVEQLLSDVVNQTKENFNYYHVHIYTLDEERKRLIVAEGTGDAGAVMKAGGHSIPLDAPTSIVVRAFKSKETIQVDNVREAADWLPNPLLPDTFAEMAVPIILEGQSVGVLDVQANKVGGLDEGDANLLRLLANNVAVALRNARLFTEMETALNSAQELQARYLEQAWSKQKKLGQQTVYQYTQPGLPPVDNVTLLASKRQAMARKEPDLVVIDKQEPDRKSVVAPVIVQNKAIGSLQIHPNDNNRPFSEDDLAIIRAVTEQLGQTAENLRLFDETREQAGRETTIREVTDKLRSAVTLNQLLETAANELGQRLNLHRATFELGQTQPSSLKDNTSNGKQGA